MRTGKLKWLLVVSCVLALGAGVFAGMVVSRLPGKTVEMPLPADHSELSDELQLSTGQRDQMRAIWEGVRSKVHDASDRAQALQKQRDDAIFAILTPEQKAKYAALTQQTADEFAALALAVIQSSGKAWMKPGSCWTVRSGRNTIVYCVIARAACPDELATLFRSSRLAGPPREPFVAEADRVGLADSLFGTITLK